MMGVEQLKGGDLFGNKVHTQEDTMIPLACVTSEGLKMGVHQTP